MLQYYVCIICVLQKGMVIIMEVEKVPIPSAACIKVSKEGKTAVFETTIIQSTDNKYFYTTPIYVDKKLVNFEQKGLIKELKVELAPFELYLWKNISIVKFVENGKVFKNKDNNARSKIRAMEKRSAYCKEEEKSVYN